MRVPPPSVMAAVVLAALVLPGCSSSSPSGGLVTRATNDAQQARLDSYVTYSQQGRSARWVDQMICVTDAGTAVVNVALSASYPGRQPDTLEASRAAAAAVGDRELSAALDAAQTQGTRLFNVPETTTRQAVDAAIAQCSTDELANADKAEMVQGVITMGEQLSKGLAAGNGGWTWVGPDGTRVWAGAASAGRQPSPSAGPSRTQTSSPTAAPTSALPTGPCSADTIANALIAFAKGKITRATALAAAGPASQKDMSDWLDFMQQSVATDPSAASHPETLLGGGAALQGLCD